MTTKIIAMRGADLASCERLWRASRTEMFGEDGQGAPERNFADDVAGEDLFGALDGDAVRGFVSLWRPEPFIHYLIVDAAARRNGIGSSLLRFAIGELGCPIDLKCGLGNRAAQAFYEHHGWHEVERISAEMPPYIRYRLERAP